MNLHLYFNRSAAVHIASFVTSRSGATLTSRIAGMLNMQAVWIFLLLQQACCALKSPPPLNATQASPTNIFGLQDALNETYLSTDGAITIFPDDCTLDHGTNNCTAACQDDKQMFGSLTTLHNCVVFSSISLHSNDSLTNETQRLKEDFNISASFDGSLIINNIQKCLLESCNNNSNCTGIFQNTSAPPFHSLCDLFRHHASADVAGIGVGSQSALFSIYVDIFTRYSFLTSCNWD